MPSRSVAIIGAGIGGLACAARLAAAGCAVTVYEARPEIGGKLRRLWVDGLGIDSGPTVLTMRWVFEELFAACGAALDEALTLTSLATLARHAWPDGAMLDLFADRARSAEAIAAFAGPAEARGYLAFCDRAAATYAALETSFIRAARPSPVSLVRAAGWRGLPGLARIAPFTTLWQALSAHFADPRLRQLFGRYATYCGSSPFAAPATLMLVAHVEQQGVWSVAGGMHALGEAVAALAMRHGAVVRRSAPVAEILAEHGRASGVRLADGQVCAADAVVVNADAAALAAGLFGAAGRLATRRRGAAGPARSLSALTWSIAAAPAAFALLRHNVFFSADYPAEFAALAAGRLPGAPTVYLCAADRLDTPEVAGARERYFVIINAPANGDTTAYDGAAQQTAAAALHRRLDLAGLDLSCAASIVTTPADFARSFPATGGALYGTATHGAMASFRRPGARTALPGLYLAGGSVHPGAGVPMAALSGAQAAASLLADGVSTSLSRRTAIAGGMSTR